MREILIGRGGHFEKSKMDAIHYVLITAMMALANISRCVLTHSCYDFSVVFTSKSSVQTVAEMTSVATIVYLLF